MSFDGHLIVKKTYTTSLPSRDTLNIFCQKVIKPLCSHIGFRYPQELPFYLRTRTAKMVKQKATVRAGKRYRYSSFKDKIADLRIEPLRNLQKRVDDDNVDSSHFLTSFNQWKERNLSSGFTRFSDEVEDIVQTLPQILYHESKILDSLLLFIGKHEETSLQPLLDLLAQFCHDIGPDFLKFYEKVLIALIELLDAAKKLDSANIFEWGFNCLAYIFKYLSRYLSRDLVPTFSLLFPLLSHSKEYISRFSAEALSFLVRKSSPKSLVSFTSYAFGQLSVGDSTGLYDGLLTLFTESLTSTEEALHSKSKIIISTLLDAVLEDDSSNATVDLFCDVWINIAHHGSQDNLAPLYKDVTDKMVARISGENLEKITHILSTLTFAESGRRVGSWSDIFSVTTKLLTHENNKNINPKSIAFLFAALMRNSDHKQLTQHHQSFFEFFLRVQPDYFIDFFKSTMGFTTEKLLTFSGNKYLQQFVNLHWKSNSKKIALFLLDVEGSVSISDRITISIPKEFSAAALSGLLSVSNIGSNGSLTEIKWNTIILKHSSSSYDPEVSKTVIALINQLVKQASCLNDFSKDIVGSLLQLASSDDQNDVYACLESILEKLHNLQNSSIFVEGFNKFLTKSQDATQQLQDLFETQKVCLRLSDNLLLPETIIRHGTLELIKTIFKIQKKEFPQLLDECQIIEQIPLSLQNARDITTRIRGLGVEYTKIEADEVTNNIFFKHLFGLLTVRFSPVWEGVYEILPKIYGKDQALVWNLLLRTLKYPDHNHSLEYFEGSVETDTDIGFWKSNLARFMDTIQLFSKSWLFCQHSESSMLAIMKERRGNLEVSPQIRSQVLKIMLMIPQLAERHSRDVVPFLFNQSELEEIFDVDGQNKPAFKNAAAWTEADRNTLLKLIGKFKNIKSTYKAEEVYERLLVLLGSRSTEVQKLALDGLLSYHDSVIVKYRDNLKNLLDDTLFKDEITNMFTDSNSRTIQEQDEIKLMPFVIRIFFGRAQTPATSGIKKSRKHAVISCLPNLSDTYISEFLRLGCGKIDYDHFFQSNHKIEDSEFSLITIRRMLGFVNVLNSSLVALGSKFASVILTAIRPLLFCIAMSYHDLSQHHKEAHMDKMVSNLRQQAMKCLNSIFENTEDASILLGFVDDIHSIVLRPRMPKFEDENLQQVSSLLKLISYWSSDETLYPFLYHSNFECPKAFMRLISNQNAKEPVIGTVLTTANNIVTMPVNEESYVELVSIIGASSLQLLPSLLKRLVNPEYVSVATDLLLNLTKSGYVDDNETRSYLLSSLTSIIKDGFKGINKNEITKVLRVLSMLIREHECSWIEIEDLYKATSALYRTYSEREIREELNEVFRGFRKVFPNLKKVSKFLNDVNSYSGKRLQEYDFPKRLSAFKSFIENDYVEYSELEWLPVISNCLYFINDQDEMAIRTNASHTLCKFVDYANLEVSDSSSQLRINILQAEILPHIRTGLRKYREEIQGEYISVLSYIVTNGKSFNELSDMQVLLFNGDEEANFFENVNHIQLHRRLRAIRRLRDFGKDLAGNSIAHYLLPIIEHYVFSREEKYRNIGNEALLTVGALSNFLTWNQYKALLRRYISLLKSKQDQIKEAVGLITHVSVSLKNALCSTKLGGDSQDILRKFPARSEEPYKFLINEILPSLSKILDVRDSETVVARIPLSEALVNLVLGLKEEDTLSLLPGILTSVCQVLRSKSEELRDATRKSLAKITTTLGSNYLPFIIRELRSTLKRGSQIHVLSYTVHHVIMTLKETLEHSDLDSSSVMLMNIIMEDIFGGAGEEKDSDNYHTKMKEVKVNRSYDTAEMLAANVSLPFFGTLLHPVKALLLQRMNFKSQNKLNELLRRFSLGLKRNSEGSSADVLTVCHEIYLQSHKELPKKYSAVFSTVDQSKDFFLVDLNAKSARVQNETTLVNTTMQKFALDLLQAVLTKHRQLLDVAYLEGFVPLLKDALDSDNESVLVSAFRVLALFVKLGFSEESEGVFKNYARKVLNIIKDSPSTTSELCQLGLKFLSAFIRHKDIKLKETALSYVLTRILPDLNEPNKQGLAFNFLKALVSKHIMLPEIYEVLDSVKEIMVTNHSKEIRDVSRSVFYQFLMEYDQSKGRLEKQFKFMVDNLQYPSPEGRQSVMELINLIVTKANPALLAKLSSSFFVGLSNVAFNDDVVRCREMATILLSNLLRKLDDSNLEVVHKYVLAWLKQEDNLSFLSLGLRIYKIYLTSVGLGHNTTLDDLALSRTKSIISKTDMGSESQWELVYTALNLFAVYVENSEKVYEKTFKDTWDNVLGSLLYPHLWVRQASARLANDLVNNMAKFEKPFTNLEVQVMASRIMRQIGAPSISEELASTSMKTLLKIAMYWRENNTQFIQKDQEEKIEKPYLNAIAFMINKIGSIIRSEENPADSFMSKKTCIQMFALLSQMLDEQTLSVEAENIILPLFIYLEYDTRKSFTDDQQELRTISQECLHILETKITVSEFTKAYAGVKRAVFRRRQERKAKRSILAVTEPSIAAEKKLRKHVRSRQKRKHEKDDNGYYQRKNKKKRA